MSLKFEIINVSNEDDTDDKEIEKALVTSQFKGRCSKCGKCGHKRQDYRSNGNKKSNENTGNKGCLNGTCNYCNIFGPKQAY